MFDLFVAVISVQVYFLALVYCLQTLSPACTLAMLSVLVASMPGQLPMATKIKCTGASTHLHTCIQVCIYLIILFIWRNFSSSLYIE